MKFVKEDLKDISSNTSLPDQIKTYSFKDFLKDKKVKSLSYKNEPIESSFLPNLTDSVKQEAVDIFNTVSLITSKTLSMDQVKQYGDKVVRKGVEVRELRDEILIQVVNQMHILGQEISRGQDMNSFSVQDMEEFKKQAWVLMAGCLSCFRPSSQFFLYLLKYVSEEEDAEKRAPCQHNLLQNFFFYPDDLSTSPSSLEERSHPPSLLEWVGYNLNASVALTVSLVDGQTFNERIHSWMTTEQFASNALIHYLNIPKDHCKGWTVTLFTLNRAYEGQGHDCLLDLVSEVETNETLALSANQSMTDSSFLTGPSRPALKTPAPSSTVPNPPPKPPLPKVPPKPKRASVKEVIVSFENIDDNDKENDETVSKNERFVQEMFDTFLDGYDGRVTEVAVVKTDEAIVTATNGSEDKNKADLSVQAKLALSAHSPQPEENMHKLSDEEKAQLSKRQKMERQIEDKRLEKQYLEVSIETETLKNKLKHLELKDEVTEVKEKTLNNYSDYQINKQVDQNKKPESNNIEGFHQNGEDNPKKYAEKPYSPKGKSRISKLVSFSETCADNPVRIGKIVWPPEKKEIEKMKITPCKLLIDERAEESTTESQSTPTKAANISPAKAMDNNSTVPKINFRKLGQSQNIMEVKGMLEKIYGSCSSKPPEPIAGLQCTVQSTSSTNSNEHPYSLKPRQNNTLLLSETPFANPPPSNQLKILTLPSKPIITYADSDWSLEIRKEFFYPGEKLSSPVCIDLLYKQIYKDTYALNCVRLTETCKAELNKTFDELKAAYVNIKVPEGKKVQVIENATYLPVYFSKVFAVEDMKDQQVKFLVLTYHNLSILYKDKTKSDELTFEFTLPYENIMPVTMKDQDTLMITSSRINLHIHTPNTSIIQNLINDYKIFGVQSQTPKVESRSTSFD